MTTPTLARRVQLRADDLSRRYGDRTVLSGPSGRGVAMTAGHGDRLGLVGENGVGKSTLLRLLAGIEDPDSGSVSVVGSRALLPQTVDVDRHATVGALLDAALTEIRSIQLRLSELAARLETTPDDDTVLAQYGDALERFEHREGWTADARLSAAVSALGVGDLPADRLLRSLSGGQRSRLALAGLLVARDDVLLLDEPTTHLDDDAVTFLEAELVTWSGVIVAASHDRAFLDAVCTAVVDIDPSRTGGALRYGGSYSDYLAARAAERVRWEDAHATWQAEVDRLTALTKPGNQRIGHTDRAPRDNDKSAVHFFGQRKDAGLARRLRDAQVRLDRLRATPVPKPPDPLRFRAPREGSSPGDGMLLMVRDAVVPGRVTVPALDVAADSRLLVTGPNGAGKSSLLALLDGTLAPARGRVMRARGVRVGLLAQDTRWPDPTLNTLSAFASGRDGDVDEQVKALLDVGVLHPRELRTAVGRLSVGQQRRVALARLLVDAPHVLLLDEPTDHLSLALVEELEDALRSRSGAVVVVTHDRWMRRRWDGETMELG